MTYLETLKSMEACSSALEWCKEFRTLEGAWQACERGDWMLWLLAKLAGDTTSSSRKKLVLVACECARLALKYIPEDETRPLVAIETAEAWARGEDGVTLSQVKAAAHAAYAATLVAGAAAHAACAAAHAACAAAHAACAAAYAACAAANATAELACANIVRKHYPNAPVLKGANYD